MDRRRESLPTRVDGLSELPPTFARTLARAAASLGLHLEPAAIAALSDHARLLIAWNAAINLTAITDPERIAVLHVADSLTAVPLLVPIVEIGIEGGRRFRLLDLGSGGGYPGLPLAVAIPGVDVLLVESVAKKARFLEAAAAVVAPAASVRVANARSESLADAVRERRLDPFHVVTARAVGALPELIELAFPLLAGGGRLVAWKRGDIAAEMEAARSAAAALGGGELRDHAVEVPGLAGHRLIVIEKTGTTPPGYPRDPGARRARPW